MVRDLSSERRETVRILSAISFNLLTLLGLYARTTEYTPLVYLLYQLHRRLATSTKLKAECILSLKLSHVGYIFAVDYCVIGYKYLAK